MIHHTIHIRHPLSVCAYSELWQKNKIGLVRFGLVNVFYYSFILFFFSSFIQLLLLVTKIDYCFVHSLIEICVSHINYLDR